MRFLAVFLGGMIGAICRYYISNEWNSLGAFPLGTFFINILGCFFLTWLLIYATKLNPILILLIGTGFTGSFTTFSTFSLENVKLLTSGAYAMSIMYTFLSIGIGLCMSYLGYLLACRMKGEKAYD
ncbi:MAG: fluoride efflux transporter CrcB [Bacillaceae bacterium]